MIRYCRFYEEEGGRRWYLADDRESSYPDRCMAGLFTGADWEAWGEVAGLRVEWCLEDEQMRLNGAPMLPGFELEAAR